MQRVAAFFFCIVATIVSLWTSCTPHHDLVFLTTAEEIVPYVRETYGSGASLLSVETSEDVNMYYLKDNQYGFEYYVRCAREPVTLDNTVMGYHEVITSNHDAEYLRTLWGKLDFSELPDGVTASFNPSIATSTTTILGRIFVHSKMDSDKGMRASMYLGKQLLLLDSRTLLPSYILLVQDVDGNTIGRFDLEGGKPISEEHVHRSMFRRQAQEIMRKEEIEMFESRYVPFSEVPGLSGEILADDIDTENAIVCVYKFRYEYKWYFIADVKVMYRKQKRYYIYNITDECSMVAELAPKLK